MPVEIRRRSPVSKFAVLIDGSALYLATRSLGESARLNYRALIDLLVKRVSGLTPPIPGRDESLWTMWTAAAPDNPGQASFLDFAEQQLHFDVRRFPPSQSFLIEPVALFGLSSSESSRTSRLIRFDGAMSFAMGRVADERRIVVVSDSFAYAEPLARVHELFGQKTGKPFIAFFGRAIDTRWHVAAKQPYTAEFINLDEHDQELFGLERKEVTRQIPQANKIY